MNKLLKTEIRGIMS